MASLNQMLFSCVHCLEAKVSANPKMSSSIEDIYQHWESMHKSESKPFQFIPVQKLRCFHCDLTETFPELLTHHKEIHSSLSFAVVSLEDHKKCGICNTVTEELIDHFGVEHESIEQCELYNPVSLSNEILSSLLDSNNKHFPCNYCHRSFETQPEIEFHHTIEHSDKEKNIITVTVPIETYLICGYCHQTIKNCDKYLNHMEDHRYEFKCSRCDFKTDKLIELVVHDKQQHRINSLNYRCLEFTEMLKKHFSQTKIIFQNGLILFNQNLLGTLLVNQKLLFDLFIEELMTIIKQKYKNEHELIEVEENGNEARNEEENELESKSVEISSVKIPNRPPVSARAYNMNELRAQNRLINNLCIYGIPYFENENKDAIFLSLCAKLQANVTQRDVAKITRAPGKNALLIVELSKFEVKERILRCAYMKQIRSSDLIRLPDGMPKSRIFINIHTTKFYGRMAKTARNAMKRNLLHTFWITKYGFLVKRNENSKDTIVLSSDELNDYINQRKQSKINREKQFYRSISWIPTTNKL